jgi:hypothetical protein
MGNSLATEFDLFYGGGDNPLICERKKAVGNGRNSTMYEQITIQDES